jgi:hypothetical protein
MGFIVGGVPLTTSAGRYSDCSVASKSKARAPGGPGWGGGEEILMLGEERGGAVCASVGEVETRRFGTLIFRKTSVWKVWKETKNAYEILKF